MLKGRTRRGVVGVVASMAIVLTLVVAISGHHPAADGIALSRMHVAAFRLRAQSGSGEDLHVRECIGTQLKPRLFLTASHCIPDGDVAIDMRCRSMFQVEAWRPMFVDRIMRHPTHDLALVFLKSPHDCSLGGHELADHLDPGMELIGPPTAITQSGTNIDDVEGLAVVVVERDEHTLRVHTPRVCLDHGDSGYPIFAPSATGSGELVGQLIAGSPDCTRLQTFLRLDTLAAWIERNGSQLGNQN